MSFLLLQGSVLPWLSGLLVGTLGDYSFDLGWGRGWYSGQINSKSRGWSRYVFFWVWNFPFSDVLYKNLFFFLFGFDLACTNHPRHLESEVSLPCSTSKAKTWAVSHSLVDVYKRNIKKQGCFYCDESISCQKEMWQNILKLPTRAMKISWQCELTDAFLQVVGGVQGDLPVSRYSRLTLLAGLTFLHFGAPS